MMPLSAGEKDFYAVSGIYKSFVKRSPCTWDLINTAERPRKCHVSLPWYLHRKGQLGTQDALTIPHEPSRANEPDAAQATRVPAATASQSRRDEPGAVTAGHGGRGDTGTVVGTWGGLWGHGDSHGDTGRAVGTRGQRRGRGCQRAGCDLTEPDVWNTDVSV